MSMFGTIKLNRNKGRCKSDPGPVGYFRTTSGSKLPVSGISSKRFDQDGAAPNLLEPDVLEAKALEKNELSCSARELPKMARRRRKLSKKLLEILSSPFGLFLLLLAYMVLGAFMFIQVESKYAQTLHTRLEETRMKYAQDLFLNESCHQDVDCVYEWLKGWENKLWIFPIGIVDESLSLWSFENAFHLCFTIVTTIGYGNITPVTKFGRILVIIYATFGIPIMLLFVSDIGTVIARWVKRFVLMYRTKRRSKPKGQTKTHHTTVATKEGRKKKGGTTNEEIGMSVRKKPELDTKCSVSKDTGFDENSRDGTDKSKEIPYEMGNGSREKRKDAILKDVNTSSQQEGKMAENPRVPVITVDSDTSDESDIEEVIGEIIDDADLYDTAEIAIHEAWNESESEDDLDVSDVEKATYQPRHPKRISQKAYPPDVESRGGSKYRRSFSEPDMETKLNEKHFHQRANLQRAKDTESMQSFDQSSQNEKTISKDTSGTLTDETKEINAQDHEAKDNSGAEFDTSSSRTHPVITETTKTGLSDNTQQGHPSQANSQEITSNGGVKSSDIPIVSQHAQRQVSYQGSSPPIIDKEVNDFSFPWWMAFFLLFIYLLIGMVMFHYALQWSYLDSFYYSFVSLSTIGFGDLYYQPSAVRGSIFYTFIYCFVGFCYTSMCMSLSSRELLRIARRIAWKIGYYRSRRWKRDFRAFWKARKLKAPRRAGRWTLRRRKPLRVQRIVSETSGVYS